MCKYYIHLHEDHVGNRKRNLYEHANFFLQSHAIISFTVRNNDIQFKVKNQHQNLPRGDQHASRIPKMYCMKSQQMGHGRVVLASMANSGQFAKSGQNRLCCQLAQPFHALFSGISCNTFFESFKHADQPWVSFVDGT